MRRFAACLPMKNARTEHKLGYGSIRRCGCGEPLAPLRTSSLAALAAPQDAQQPLLLLLTHAQVAAAAGYIWATTPVQSAYPGAEDGSDRDSEAEPDVPVRVAALRGRTHSWLAVSSSWAAP